jgi:hypothetical protein
MNVVPVVFGSGRPFFASGNLPKPLRLENPSTIVQGDRVTHLVYTSAAEHRSSDARTEEVRDGRVDPRHVGVTGNIADADDYLGGDDGERLHKWADAEAESAQPSAPIREFDAEWKAAGAVLAGRRTAELMDHWGGSHMAVFRSSCPVTGRRPGPPVGVIRW